MRSFKVKAANRKRVGMGIVARLDAIAAAALDSSAKSLLIMLAKHLRTETAGVGGVAWPSLKTLAAQAGMSEDTASRTMGRLEKAGIVITVTKAAQGRSARRAIDWTALAASAPRMRVQDANLRKIQNPEDAGSRPPRMRVLDLRGCGSLTSEDAVSRTPRLGADPFRDPEKESVQGSEKESVQDTREERPTMHPLSQTIADDIRRRHNFTTDSRPTMDTDPIDNDEAMTPPSVPAVSSPRCGVRSLGSSLVCDREPHTDGLHECGPFAFSNDFYTPTTDEVSDGQVTPHDAQPVGLHRLPDAAGPVSADAAPEAAVAVASTLSPAPATSETSATPDPGKVWSLHPQADVAPPAKPKRKAKAATTLDLDAWGRCCQAWDGMTGRTRAWRPEAGDGKTIAAAMLEQGTVKVAARFDQAARDAWCCGAARDSSRPLSVSALTRAKTALTSRLDAAAEQATLDAESRSGEPQAVGGVVGRSESQNAQERQPAPKQPVSWPDVLRDLGSDPQHHPDDGPHREAWQRVRQAVLVSIRKPGDPWLVWCRADDRARQNVERLLVGGLVK